MTLPTLSPQDASFAVLLALLGLLVGSFSNVLIWRLPRHENINFPPSHCPNCDARLRTRDLIPVLSWVGLRGRCHACQASISVQYPLVELATAAGYGLLACAFPHSQAGTSLYGLCLLFTLLLVCSVIDQQTATLPDELTLPGALAGLLLALSVDARPGQAGSLPGFSAALQGLLLGAGLLVLIDLLGSWVLRRFQERRHPEFPLGYPQLSLALLIGSWTSPLWACAAVLLNVAVNLRLKRAVHLPEWVTLPGWLITLTLAAALITRTQDGPAALHALNVAATRGVTAAGAAALLCGLYWWADALTTRRRNTAGNSAPPTETAPAPDRQRTGEQGSGKQGTGEQDADGPYDLAAMGFGDVKLAALIGAFLGPERLIVALAAAVLLGAVIGAAQQLTRSGNRLKFGPYLAAGALISLLYGEQLSALYRQFLGL